MATCTFCGGHIQPNIFEPDKPGLCKGFCGSWHQPEPVPGLRILPAIDIPLDRDEIDGKGYSRGGEAETTNP